MAKQSAGLLVYRKTADQVEVLLVHPGGPFWSKKDTHAWSIPKGEYKDSEAPFEVAKREFKEEIGQEAPNGEYLELGEIKQTGGKRIVAWAIEKDLGPIEVKSNTFKIEWPPKSGQQQEFPEVDKADWFDLPTASAKLHPGQNEFLKQLAEKLNVKFEDQNPSRDASDLNNQQISLL